MKKAMTITAFNRPDYLSTVLESLKSNNLKDYELFVGCEPVNKEVINICNNIDFIKTYTQVNPQIYGVRKNPFEVLSRAFNSGADCVLYLEDDVVLSPDAVHFANWYFDWDQKDNYICMNLYNHDSDENFPDQVIAGTKFSSLCMGITKFQWDNFIGKEWFVHPSGWDFSFNKLLAQGKKVIMPKLSRSHHIGVTRGVHYVAREHDKIYAGNKFYQGADNFEFKFVP